MGGSRGLPILPYWFFKAIVHYGAKYSHARKKVRIICQISKLPIPLPTMPKPGGVGGNTLWVNY